MYNGFMKLGVSFMGLFFGVWMVASVIDIGPLALLAAVIWFYAFFDCINKIFQPDDEFYTQEDRYLFTKEQIDKMHLGIIREKSLLAGIVLIVVGIYALWNGVVLHLLSTYHLLPPVVYQAIADFGYLIPKLLVGGLIIWAGIALVAGKKREVYGEGTAEPKKPEAADGEGVKPFDDEK
jgi:hypothetical protein